MYKCPDCLSTGGARFHDCSGISKETEDNFYKRAFRKTPDMITLTNKCGVCGSTAIDHTEMQCRINQKKKG